MIPKLEELNKRLEKLEKKNDQEAITLVEILSNATFFGQMKKSTCKYAKNGQCSLFILNRQQRNQLPLTAKCRIKDCKEPTEHWHIVLSNLTCSLCKGDY
jgi:hypothetical protein